MTIRVMAVCEDCGKMERLQAKSVKGGQSEVERGHGFVADGEDTYCEACAVKRGLLAECPGEAHSNAWIDNCGVCAPRWGFVVPSKV